MTEEKQEKKTGYELVQVPTQMDIAIQTPKGQTISQVELLVEIANKLERIEKGIVG